MDGETRSVALTAERMASSIINRAAQRGINVAVFADANGVALRDAKDGNFDAPGKLLIGVYTSLCPRAWLADDLRHYKLAA